MKRNLLSLFILFSLVLAACAPAATPTPVAPTEAPAAAPTTAPVRGADRSSYSWNRPLNRQLNPRWRRPASPPQRLPPVRPAKAVQLPDLEGAEGGGGDGERLHAAQLCRPADGEAVGWEYDAVNEICRRLNCQVDWQVTAVGHDDCGGERRPVRCRDGRDHDHG